MLRLVSNAVLLTALLGATLPANAASLKKTYSYFSIGGSSLAEIEKELSRHGPHVQSTGHRHPGATQIEFTTRLGYSDSGTYCSIVKATVSVKAKVILPRWRQRGRSDGETRLIWDTLSSDIKRHEESHIIIAKNHARTLEDSVLALRRQKSCDIAAAKAKAISEKVLAAHDRAQEQFDKVEGINFESRIVRLLRYRIERIEATKAKAKAG